MLAIFFAFLVVVLLGIIIVAAANARDTVGVGIFLFLFMAITCAMGMRMQKEMNILDATEPPVVVEPTVTISAKELVRLQAIEAEFNSTSIDKE